MFESAPIFVDSITTLMKLFCAVVENTQMCIKIITKLTDLKF